MTVEEFNINKGLYIFKVDDIDTEFHSHPIVEIIIANSGDFTLITDNGIYYNLKFAIIPSNKRHKLCSTNCKFKIIMIEHHQKFVVEYLKEIDIELINEYYLLSISEKEVIQINNLIQNINNKQAFDEYDYRICNVIKFLNQNDLEYSIMIDKLKSITNLSESRLSHLFKSSIGISLKKYLIWSKLKSTIQNHLNNKNDLFTSLIESGFYDQPHFSKSFKSMLGVKPSKTYNSRILQV